MKGVLTADEDAGSSTGSSVPAILKTYNSGGAGAAGLSTVLGFSLETATEGTYNRFGEIYVTSVDATAGSADGKMTFRVYEDSSTVDAMSILPNGNVGVGTGTPGEKLSVYNGRMQIVSDGTDWDYIDVITYSDTKNSQQLHRRARGTPGTPTYIQSGDKIGELSFRNHTNANGSAVMAFATQTHTASVAGSDLRLATVANGQNAFATRLIIEHDGDVGIGTTLPSQLLDVASTTTNAYVNIDGADSASSSLAFVTKGEGAFNGASNKSWAIQAIGDSNAATTLQNDLRVMNFNGGTGRLDFFIDSITGNVGLGGTAAPAQKLDVYGNIAVSGTTVHTSDIRLKEKVGRWILR